MKRLLLLLLTTLLPSLASAQGLPIKDGNTGTLADVFSLASSNPIACAVVDGTGAQLTSFGGGTQYIEGDTDSTITGTAMLWEDTSDTLRSVSAAKPLPVNVVAGGAGDGSILDGVSSSIKATVFDLTNSNPVSCAITDGNGDQITSFGGGTQYNQGTATTDTDTLTMAGAVRRDTAAVATGVADGDRLALSTDSVGRLRVSSADLTQPISGTVTANAGSGTFTVGDGSGALNVIVDSGTVAATQSGTWTVQPGNTANTTPWLMSLNEGGVTADILDLTNNNPLTVAILDGAGSQITSFGGGTQYTEADTDASITGTALLWEDAADTLRAASAAKPLPTRLSDGTDQVLVSGTGSLQVTCDNCGAPSSFADNSAFTFGTTGISNAGFVLDDAAPNAATENSAAAARISANRMQLFQLGDGAGNERRANVTAGNALVVDGSAVTQPISAASLPLPTGAATAANQDGIVKDGAGDTTQANVSTGRLHVDGSGVTQPVSGTVQVGDGVETATVRDTGASDSLNVAIVDAAGAQVTSFGGTQYVEDDAGATNPTGTALNFIRQDVITALVTTNGDNVSARGSNFGALYTTDLMLDGAEPYVDQGTIPTTDEPLLMAGAVRRDTAAVAGGVINGDRITLSTDSVGRLRVTADDTTQPISGTVNVGTFPDNEPINVAQMNGVAVTMGNGAAGTGVQRVTIANDSTGVLATVTTVGTVTNLTNLPNEGQQTAANSISVTPDTDNDPIGTVGSAVPNEAMLVGGTDGTNTTVLYLDPCQREARTVYRVDIVTATTTEIAAAVASEFYWICSVNLVTAGANNVIIVEDDTATNCPSPTAGVSSGGTTAAEGYNFAANGGMVVGTGSNWVMKTGTANRSICIITSAAVQLSGTITYVSAP